MGRYVTRIKSKPLWYFGMFVILISIVMGGSAAFWFNFDMQGLFVAFVVLLIGLFIISRATYRDYEPNRPPDI